MHACNSILSPRHRYPLVSTVAFEAFACEGFDTGRWLRADYAVRCDGAEYTPVFNLAVIALICIPMLISGCSRPPVWEREDPSEALRGFLAALKVRQLETVWQYLEDEDRAVLEARAESIAERSNGLIKPEPYELLRAGHIIASSDEISSIKRDPDGGEGDSARMVVHLHDTVRPEDKRSFTLDMTRRSGRWTVALPLAESASPVPPTESP